jgi:hypothetical protein
LASFGNFQGKGRTNNQNDTKRKKKKNEKGLRKSFFWQLPRTILKAKEGKMKMPKGGNTWKNRNEKTMK